MPDNISGPEFHKYIDSKLLEKDFHILPVTENLMKERLGDFMEFVNSVRTEYSDVYGWSAENKNYFLNGLVDKWKFSFAVFDKTGEICFVNFSSVYGDIIHNHCTYAGKKYRRSGLAKLHNLKLCQTGLDNGFTEQEGYWPKTHNKSIILFLQMGWKIDKVLEDKAYVKMKAELEKVRDKTFEMLNK